MAHVRIEIVDEDDRVLGPGSTGEITVTAATAGTWAGCFPRPALVPRHARGDRSGHGRRPVADG